MEFRDFGDRRTMQKPNLDVVDLSAHPGEFEGLVDLTAVAIEGGTHTGLHAEGEITYASLTGVGLNDTTFGPLSLADVLLVGCDLSNARWQRVSCSRVELDSCRAVGFILDGSLADVYAVDTRFDLAALRLERGRGWTVFERCSFHDAVIAGCLDHVIFRACDLTGVRFEASSAKGADLRGSRLEGVRGVMSLSGAALDTDQVHDVAKQLAAEAGFLLFE